MLLWVEPCLEHSYDAYSFLFQQWNSLAPSLPENVKGTGCLSSPFPTHLPPHY